MNKPFSFTISAQFGDLARVGVIHTPHGDIETPTFSVVGTHAEVKCLSPDDLRAVGIQVMLSNGYHLLRRAVMIDAAGGLAKFNGWHGPTMTDSGGFQVMSLGSGLGKIVSMSEGKITASSEPNQPRQSIAVTTRTNEETRDDGLDERTVVGGLGSGSLPENTRS
ncbi:tRNA-guanine transglycosylase, partial [Candidatus Saccharibacteria bacterium]|nr:tRNA-guanine transglycosylase [Candidatus Saccharibacteria bacterium]